MSPRRIPWYLWCSALSVTLAMAGVHWDISWHRSIGRDAFLTPPHVAILDITGVPAVDTLVAQHLLKTVQAARLMGAECIISGIRPQIAQTIVHLGVDLGNVITKASLADAFNLALKQKGLCVSRAQKKTAEAL